MGLCMLPWVRYMWKEQVVSPHRNTGTGNQTATTISALSGLRWGFSAWCDVRGKCSGVAALEQSLAREHFASLSLEKWEPL